MKNRGLKNRVYQVLSSIFVIPAIYSLLVESYCRRLQTAISEPSLAMGKGLRTLEFSFETPNLTTRRNGPEMQAFLVNACVCDGCWQRDRDHPHPRWRLFQPADLLLAMLYVLSPGLRRVSRTEILQYKCVPFAVESGFAFLLPRRCVVF